MIENQILHGDAADLALQIEQESVDLIFTDPPYLKEFLPSYGVLADIAARVLKPGCFVLAMAGGLYADSIMAQLAEHLTYYWTFHVHMTGKYTGKVHPGGNHMPIITRVKPIYCFVKGWGEPRTVLYDPIVGGGNDKRFHHWGQEMLSARYLIDCFSEAGNLVLDPFVGGGTTAVVAQALERRYLGFDIDHRYVEIARGRLRNPHYLPKQDNGQLRLEFAT